MSKGFKVHRYGYDRRQQKKRHVLKVILTVVLVLGACVAGWFLYEPVSGWIKEVAAEQKIRQEQKEQERLEAEREEQEQQQEPEEVTPEVPVPPVDDKPFAVHSCPMTAEELLDTAALPEKFRALAAEGWDGVILPLKDKDGLVRYESALEEVTSSQFQTASRYDLAAVVKAAKEAGLTPIGRLYAFRDRTATKTMHDAAVKFNYSKTNWIDNSAEAGGKSWLNPAHPEAQEYILSLLQEAADAGLRQIVLEGAQFPEGYSLNLATYAEKGTPVNKSEVLASFLTKAKKLADEHDCRLWAAVPVSVTSGVNRIPYGENVGSVLRAVKDIVVDVAPAQFGKGLESETLTLKDPVRDPYGTVRAALAASPILKNEDFTLAAEVQGYTAPLPSSHNLTYGREQIDLQIKAIEEFGIECHIVDPLGTQ